MYIWEKFYLASKALNETALDNRQALENAYTNHLIMLREDDFPDHLVDAYLKVKSAVTLPNDVPPIGGHSGCSHAISALTDEEVQETISLIHDIFREIEKLKKED